MQQTAIKQLVEKYDAFLLDIWGVIYEEVNPYPGTIECLDYLVSKNKTIFFLSNAPRPGKIIMNKLINFGFKMTEEMILTSGDMVREQLIHLNDPIFKKRDNCFYHLGANRNSDILAGISLNLTTNIEQADFMLLTAYIDEGEDLDQYDDLLKKTALLKIPVLCANPDKAIVHGKKLRYCAGVLAEKYQKMGGIVHFYGKPYLSIYEAAFKKLNEQGVDHKNRILMIGDTLETDILGANNAKIDSALVLSGNTGLLLAKAKEEDPTISPSQFLYDLAKKMNINPNWILEKFSN